MHQYLSTSQKPKSAQRNGKSNMKKHQKPMRREESRDQKSKRSGQAKSEEHIAD
jgi:hypothetical protein